MIDQSRYGFIYKTTFSKTNMFYIGKRVIQNNCMDNTYLGSGTIISKLIKKYGAESFSREIVKYCDSEEELLYWEEQYVKIFKATNKSIGYNIQEGGKCTPNIKNHPNKKEILEKRSRTFKDKYRNNPEAQIKRKEQLAKAKERVDHKKIGLKRRKKIVELDIETNKIIRIYDSVTIVQEVINKTGICSAIKNKNLCAGRYFQYLNQENVYPRYIKKEVWNKGSKGLVKSSKSSFQKGHTPHNKNIPRSIETKRKISDSLKGNIPWNKGIEYLAIKGNKHFASKAVLCFNGNKLIREYESFTQVVNEGFTRGCVVRACKKYLGTYRNLKWCLKSDYEKRENK